MKKIYLLLLLCSCWVVGLRAQLNQIKIVSFTVKNQLPARVDDWVNTPGALLLTAQRVPGTQVKELKLLLQLKNNGSLLCGTTLTTAPPVGDLTTRTFSTAELVGMLGNCKELKEGSYTICAQFFNVDRLAVSQEMCREFTVAASKEAEYAPPTLITPEDGKKYTEAELSRPLNFRWTPLVPKPKEPVTYRLRVWQLMQGQNGTAAMRTNQHIVTKDVDNITQAVVTNIYTGPCRPPYLCDFVWQVQALNREGKPIGNNEGKSEPYRFGLQDAGAKPPVLLAPADKKGFSPAEAQQSIIFRWMPPVPKPQTPVTYRLRVWQLMQGQNGTAAMRSNKPIVTKDVTDVTEATVTGLYTGPCRPPYLCDFVWNVQALDREGKPIGENEGTSQTWAFLISQYIIQIDSIKVKCTDKPGVYSFAYTITNPNAGPATLNVFTITSSTPAGATIGSFAPPIGTNVPAGSQLTITGSINAASNLSNICIGAEIKDVGNGFWKASKDTCINVVPCRCNGCDSVKIDVPEKGDVKPAADGSLILSTNISVSPKPVKSIKAELVYMEYKPETEDCMVCNKNSQTFGNFTAAAAGNQSLLLPHPHTAQWISNSPNGQPVTNTPLQFTISMPPTVKCCAAEVKWCIRYVVTFSDCTVCNKLVCYSYNKKCDCNK